VGGDFYYKKVGVNLYTVTLKLYMDCENGNPQAIASDAQAIISFWNAKTNAFRTYQSFSRTGPKYLDKIHYQCLIPPRDVCVAEYVYKRTIFLDPGKDGVILAFQRCCRNNSINNIVEPESTGATYWVKIPGTDVVSDNSSAIFKELPPNYLCTDAPLQFDHSATDPDGDSLIYELYKPYKGASRNQPRPDNDANGLFKAPDFENIIWKIPYSTFNQVSGDPMMEINRFTGELTLLPNLVGQYVIGIKVKEYRDGIFKSIKLSRAGKAYYYTETSFPDISQSRIDGLIIVVTKGVITDATFFEMKNKNNGIDKNQIEDYLSISKTLKVDKLVTVSNEFVADSTQAIARLSLRGILKHHKRHSRAQQPALPA